MDAQVIVVGAALDLSWKLAATLQGWGGGNLLNSYEVERRQIGERNVGALRYAPLSRRKWRSQVRPEIRDKTPAGQAARDVYGVDLILLRPDMHVVWRGNAAPAAAAALAATATGH